MTDPSKERIAAALRLAQTTELLGRTIDGEGVVTDQLLADNRAALVAYRATLPRIRSRAEVDGEIVQAVREQWLAGKGGGMIWDGLLRTTLERLCREPTDSGPGSVDTTDPPPVPVSPAGAAYSPDFSFAGECHRCRLTAMLAPIGWDNICAKCFYGPPGVAAAKESTDNAAALEGAANCEAERCSCEESEALREQIVHQQASISELARGLNRKDVVIEKLRDDITELQRQVSAAHGSAVHIVGITETTPG